MTDRFWRDEWLDATLFDNGWVLVVWVKSDVGYLSKNFIKSLKNIERMIKEKGLEGWFCSSEPEHTTMHKIITKFGCEPLGEQEGLYWFRKKIGGSPCVVDRSETSSKKQPVLSLA